MNDISQNNDRSNHLPHSQILRNPQSTQKKEHKHQTQLQTKFSQ